MSATARSARPATRRPSSRPATRASAQTATTPHRGTGPAARAAARRRAPLVALPAPAPAVAGNGVFALVVVGMLVGGMVLLLVLNTSLAQGAFEIGSLSRTQNQLAVEEQRLLQEVAKAEAPEALQRRADSLGMVPVVSPVFLRLADGVVLGVPKAAAAVPRPSLPTTGVAAAPAAAAAPATPAVKTPRTDAAVADPAPVTDAAAPESATTGATR